MPKGTCPSPQGCPTTANPCAGRGRGAESGSGQGRSTQGCCHCLNPTPAFHEQRKLFSKPTNRFLWGVLCNSELKPKKQRKQRKKGTNKETNQNLYPGCGISCKVLQDPWPLLVVQGLLWDYLGFYINFLLSFFFLICFQVPQDKCEEHQRNDGELQPHRIPTELLPDPAL